MRGRNYRLKRKMFKGEKSIAWSRMVHKWWILWNKVRYPKHPTSED